MVFDKLFGKKERELAENEVRIVLPEESWTLVEYMMDGLPSVTMVNSGLMDFEYPEIFRWHLSLIIDFDEVVQKGMPSQEERDVVDPFCERLDEEIKAGGNALLLVRETWNKTRRLVWMVYDAEIAHQHLQHIIKNHLHPRPFDYRMEEDREWKEPEVYFRTIREQLVN